MLAMCLRLWCALVLCLTALGLCGCYQPTEGQSDEQKNEYFVVGKERIAARDYKGAIDAFEKVIELRPRSPLAHYEVAMLYEQHSDQKETDYICAMYHYVQAIKLKPNEYPAENARQRLNACKQELFKNETLSLTAHDIMRERERFKQDNESLRTQLEALKAELANRPLQDGTRGVSRGSPTTGVSRVTGPGPGTPGGPRGTQPPTGVRTHSVKPRDTMASISRQYNVKLSSLEAANPNVDARRLKIGQVINLPGQ
jgi:tetratricopeptide (TPR) repeat protein